MKKIINYIALVILMGIGQLPLYTQSLEDLKAMALENNPGLNASYQKYLAAQAVGPQVSQLPDMEFGVGVFALPVETRLGPQWVRLGATQMFPWKGTLKAKEELAFINAQSQLENYHMAGLKVMYRLEETYYRLYEVDRSREIISRNLDLYGSLERIALIKLEAGEGKMSDVLKVQLKKEELTKQLDLLLNKREQPLITINQLLSRPLYTPIEFSDTLGMAIIPMVKDSLLFETVEKFPGLKQLELQQELAQQAIKVNDLDKKPSFGLGLDYLIVGSRTDADPANNGRDALMPRVMIKLPLSQKKYAARQQEEERNIAALEYQEKNLKLQLSGTIEKAFTEYQDAVIQYDLYQEQLKTLDQIQRLLQTEYSVSGRDFDELLEIRLQMTNYELMQMKAIVQSYQAKARIMQFLGQY